MFVALHERLCRIHHVFQTLGVDFQQFLVILGCIFHPARRVAQRGKVAECPLGVRLDAVGNGVGVDGFFGVFQFLMAETDFLPDACQGFVKLIVGKCGEDVQCSLIEFFPHQEIGILCHFLLVGCQEFLQPWVAERSDGVLFQQGERIGELLFVGVKMVEAVEVEHIVPTDVRLFRFLQFGTLSQFVHVHSIGDLTADLCFDGISCRAAEAGEREAE